MLNGYDQKVGGSNPSERPLRAQNKSPRTIQTYGDDDICRLVAGSKESGTQTKMDRIAREHVEMFVAEVLGARW